MNIAKKIALCGAVAAAATTVEGFAPLSSSPVQLRKWQSAPSSSSALRFFGGGSGAKDLDEQWEAQQELLRLRQASPAERERYFKSVEDRRIAATEEQIDKWAWQRREYARGEDPIDEWRKRRASGQISDLENQYGDPRTVGGIPIPSASFGVGGEFGVGGKFDNGGRFDLRLPYADQGWVDEEAEGGNGNPLANLFGGGKKKENKEEGKEEKEAQQRAEGSEKPKKNGFGWPF